ncbi:MAG: GLPGLI family protein [Cyclobacteriaceae bacterium]
MKLSSQKLFINLLLLATPFFSFGQWTVIDSSYLKVEYLYQYRPYQEDSITIDEPVVLLVGDEWIQYTNAKNHELDKVIHAPKKQNMNFTGMVGSTRDLPKAQTHSFSIYRKRTSDTVYTRHSGAPMYQYIEKSIDFAWKITDERKELYGYDCIKALGNFRGREYVVWFAPDIPILAGPYKFSGLPGLIVEVADSDQHHVFKFMNITEYQGPLVKSYTHEYKPYGKWVHRTIKSYVIGVQNGYAIVKGKLKTKIVPNTATKKNEWLISSSAINPIERN